jgi:fructose-1,6-bisphosphatase I
MIRTTLSEHLRASHRYAVDACDIHRIIESIAAAIRSISEEVGRGMLAAHGPAAPTANVHGEVQQRLDLLANDVLLDAASGCALLGGFASEELEHPQTLSRTGRYLLLVDPLDGSSNIAINAPVGTIFSILRAPDAVPFTTTSFLQPGHMQVAAGYAIYGPATELVLTIESGVDRFTLDRASGEWLLSGRNLKIAHDTAEYAINGSNARLWEPPVARYVSELVAGNSGPRQRDFNTRWIASLVADLHRLLTRGGIFMYPLDTRTRARGGRLRLLYECNPAALLIERADGMATTGRSRVLELQPASLHQHAPLIMGARSEVIRLTAYHTQASFALS